MARPLLSDVLPGKPRSRERLGEAAKQLAASYGKDNVLAFLVDACILPQVEKATGDVAAQWGPPDVWVNNVGYPTAKKGPGYTAGEFDAGVDANLRSTLFGCQTAAAHMANGGVIVNISSMAARYPTAGDKSLYGPLKAAVQGLTVTLGTEYAASGIRVVGVAPGGTETDTTRTALSAVEEAGAFRGNVLNRFAQPADIANVVVFLASARAGHIACTSVDVSGGSGVVTNPDYSYQKKGS